jgi:hypothetical protein
MKQEISSVETEFILIPPPKQPTVHDYESKVAVR